MENSLSIPTESKELFISVNNFVKDYMSHYDASHDYSHILRVTSNANRILSSELKANPGLQYDLTAIFLSTYVKTMLANILFSEERIVAHSTRVPGILKLL